MNEWGSSRLTMLKQKGLKLKLVPRGRHDVFAIDSFDSQCHLGSWPYSLKFHVGLLSPTNTRRKCKEENKDMQLKATGIQGMDC